MSAFVHWMFTVSLHSSWKKTLYCEESILCVVYYYYILFNMIYYYMSFHYYYYNLHITCVRLSTSLDQLEVYSTWSVRPLIEFHT